MAQVDCRHPPTTRCLQSTRRCASKQSTVVKEFSFLNRGVNSPVRHSSADDVIIIRPAASQWRTSVPDVLLTAERIVWKVGWRSARSLTVCLSTAQKPRRKRGYCKDSTNATMLTCLWAAGVLGHLLKRRRRRLRAEKRAQNRRRHWTSRRPFASTPPTSGSCRQSVSKTAAGDRTIPLVRGMEWPYLEPVADRQSRTHTHTRENFVKSTVVLQRSNIKRVVALLRLLCVTFVWDVNWSTCELYV